MSRPKLKPVSIGIPINKPLPGFLANTKHALSDMLLNRPVSVYRPPLTLLRTIADSNSSFPGDRKLTKLKRALVSDWLRHISRSRKLWQPSSSKLECGSDVAYRNIKRTSDRFRETWMGHKICPPPKIIIWHIRLSVGQWPRQCNLIFAQKDVMSDAKSEQDPGFWFFSSFFSSILM